MLRQRTRALQAAIAVTDAAATVAAFFGTYYGAGFLPERLLGLKTVLPISQYLWVLIVSVPLWWVLFGFFGCYDLSPIERARDSLLRMAAPMAVGALAVGAAVFFSKEPLFSRRVVGAFLVGNAALLIAGRVVALKAASRFYRAAGAERRVLVVGVGEAAQEFGEAVRRAGWGLDFAGHVAPSPETMTPECVGVISELPKILDERAVDDVVIADTGGDLAAVQQVIHACEEVGVCIHIPSRFFAAALSRPHLEAFSGIRMLTFTTAPYNPIALGIKRAADLLGSLVLLILLGIPMLIFSVIVKFTSPGPVFFKQRRSGLYGREFTMVKFRSMVADAEGRRAELAAANEMAGPVFKMRHDPRVTPFGRVLRRYSLDELPQLWNVLKGDMSLIGPRPPIPTEVQKYERWQRRRLSMRPGLTCIWQVTDRSLLRSDDARYGGQDRATFEKWMEYDLNYIDHWSLWLDFKIALQTIPAVLKGTGV